MALRSLGPEFFTVCNELSIGVDTSFLEMLLHLEFKLNFSTIFVGSFDIGASREFFLYEVRSPEIPKSNDPNILLTYLLFEGRFAYLNFEFWTLGFV